MNNTENLEHTGEFIDYKEVNSGIKSNWSLEAPINEKVTSWEDDASWEILDDVSWEDIADEVSLEDEDEVTELWGTCDYRCVVCYEDQCFCEDGYKRKLVHQRDCKACKILYDGGVFIN